MRVRDMVELRADFPDDTIERDGEIVRFGGRNIAVGLGELLTGMGADVSDPTYAGDHGWEFDFHLEGRRLWCQVTQMGETEAILVFKDMSRSFGDGLFGRPPNPIFANILTRLNAAMALDPRFSEVLWYVGDDSKAGGALDPVIEEP